MAAGGHADVFNMDLAQADATEQLVSDVMARFGRLDAAFHNAGVAPYLPLDQITAEDFDTLFATDVRAVLLLIKHEVAAIRRRHRQYLVHRRCRRPGRHVGVTLPAKALWTR